MRRKPLWSNRRKPTCCLALHLLAAGFFLFSEAQATDSHRAEKPKKNVSHDLIKQAVQVAPPLVLSSSEIFGEENEADEVGLQGLASYYGHRFAGRKTASGERYDPQVFGAASNRFPLGTRLLVRRLDNGRCVIVRVNDRMHPKHQKRIIDLSYGVAKTLDMLRHGVLLVRVEPFKPDSSSNCDQSQ